MGFFARLKPLFKKNPTKPNKQKKPLRNNRHQKYRSSLPAKSLACVYLRLPKERKGISMPLMAAASPSPPCPPLPFCAKSERDRPKNTPGFRRLPPSAAARRPPTLCSRKGFAEPGHGGRLVPRAVSPTERSRLQLQAEAGRHQPVLATERGARDAPPKRPCRHLRAGFSPPGGSQARSNVENTHTTDVDQKSLRAWRSTQQSHRPPQPPHLDASAVQMQTFF